MSVQIHYNACLYILTVRYLVVFLLNYYLQMIGVSKYFIMLLSVSIDTKSFFYN